MQKPNLNLSFSKLMLVILLSIHGCLGLIILQLNNLPLVIKFSLLLGLMLSFVKEMKLHATRSHSLAIDQCWQTHSGWYLRLRNNEIVPVELQNQNFVTPYFMVLRFVHTETNQRHNLVLCLDNLPVGILRKIYVYLTTTNQINAH